MTEINDKEIVVDREDVYDDDGDGGRENVNKSKIQLKRRQSFKRDKIDEHYDKMPWVLGAIGRILGLKFAPLDIPMERRLQTFAVFQWMFTFLIIGLGSWVVFLYMLLFTRLWWVALCYFTWFMGDRTVCRRGGRRNLWMRNWKIWKHKADFFPAKLIKTAEISPDKNYILGYHPHGILCAGGFVHFCTEGSNFSKIFPGITSYMVTLEAQFMIPFYRDYVLMTGTISADRSSLEYVLNQDKTGNLLVIVIGGAKESLDAHPGMSRIFLKNRKGFCKVALRTGTSLIPVFSFGETEIYDQLNNPEGSWIRTIQNLLLKYIGFAPCIFMGRGMFQYSFGIVPYRKPIFTIVGAPLDVPLIKDPTQSDIDQLHTRYVEALTELYNKHRKAYAPDPNVDLEII